MQTELFIGGRYAKPKAGGRFTDVEPATELELAQVAEALEEDVANAIAAAHRLPALKEVL